ncbi:MAG: PAS domain S-box protein [Methanoregulaceae archaeon]|jgi:PAS domain S-box-containing protein|nr:PAS domain S-box protein [Methanoregulaceae archaeon]
MELRTKTLIIFGIGLILILAGFTAYSLIVLQKSYEDIEHAEVRQDIERVNLAIGNELFVLDSSLLDWSSWDDTYNFSQGNSPAYIEENLQKSTFQTLNLNFLLIYNRSGDLVYANGYNDQTDSYDPVPLSVLNKIKEDYSRYIFESPGRNSSVRGIFFADKEPRIVAVRPILKNDGTGPAEGIMVMGSNLDENRVEQLSTFTGVSVAVIDPSSMPENPSLSPFQDKLRTENIIVINPVNRDSIAGYMLSQGSDSFTDNYILGVKKSRIIYQSGVSTLYSFLFIVLIAVLIFGITGLVLIDRLVLSRVSTITNDVRMIGSGKENQRISEVPGNDELTQLSRAINQMLEKISLIQLRYKSIVEDQTELICRFDPEGHITFMNPAFKRNIESSVRDMENISFYDINPRLSLEQLEQLFIKLTVQSPIISGEQEFPLGEEELVISWTIRAIFDPGGILQEYQFVGSDITSRKQAEAALQQITRKLTLLNQVTFNDIQNAVFTLNGYITLENTLPDDEMPNKYHEMEMESLRKIEYSLNFAKNYQDLGVRPPEWQNVEQSFILGISHLDFSSIERNIRLDNLEIYADSLLERVFFTMAGNVLRHGKKATRVNIGYQVTSDGLVLFFEDNGVGIPDTNKEKIFERGYGTQQGMELFLVREILAITGIKIRETGKYRAGACFEMDIPKRTYRFPEKE